jgi:hypothetical protein
MRSIQRVALFLALAVLTAMPSVMADFETGWNYFKSAKYLEAASEFQALVDESPD